MTLGCSSTLSLGKLCCHQSSTSWETTAWSTLLTGLPGTMNTRRVSNSSGIVQELTEAQKRAILADNARLMYGLSVAASAT